MPSDEMKKSDKKLKEEIVKKKMIRRNQNLKDHQFSEQQSLWTPAQERKKSKSDSKNKKSQNHREIPTGM